MKREPKSKQMERIKRARREIIMDAPFFGSLLMRLKTSRDDSAQTFCTDGARILFNEGFCESLTDGELRGVLVHEVCHVAQGHIWRAGGRDMQRWNEATDYQINSFLVEYTAEMKAKNQIIPWDLPQQALLDPQYAGLSSEAIYARLRELPPGIEPPPPSPGRFTTAPPTEPDGSNTEGAWKVAVAQAAMSAKFTPGGAPPCIMRLVNEVLNPKVPWRQVMREFIRAKSRDDYSWTRPNRRFAGMGAIMPGLYREHMGPVVVGIDTSGSIGDEELAEFQAEAQAALDECQPDSMLIIYCDDEVQGTDEFLPGEAITLRSLGGGSTDFRPVFAEIEKMGEHPSVLIYLTDGHGTSPSEEPDYPVLWATTDKESFPFGEVVAVK